MKENQDTVYIHGLISEGEHLHQDFKFAISDPRKIARSLSAFSNTKGGRLLVGVKDNGKIAGVDWEEEVYMIEAAAEMYCKPVVPLVNRRFRVEGKDVLEVYVAESDRKPVCALDESNRPWAYVRIADENILASAVHLEIWKNAEVENAPRVVYTGEEKKLLEVLDREGKLTLNQCSRKSGLERRICTRLLADFIRFELVEVVFVEHTFYFKLKDTD